MYLTRGDRAKIMRIGDGGGRRRIMRLVKKLGVETGKALGDVYRGFFQKNLLQPSPAYGGPCFFSFQGKGPWDRVGKEGL